MTEESIVRNFEESYHLYENIRLYCGIAAIVFVLLTVVLFVALRIPQVFGELTGRTARRAVQRRMGGGQPAARKKASGARSYRDLDGTNDTPVSLVVQDEAVTPTVIGQAPDIFPDQAVSCPPEETETVKLEQTGEQETTMLRDVSEEPKREFVILRSIVEIHTDEVIEK